MLENDEGQAEVSLRQADQILSEQRFSSTLFLSLAAVQEWHHPLEDVFHIVLCARLVDRKTFAYKQEIRKQFMQYTKMDMNRCPFHTIGHFQPVVMDSFLFHGQNP